MEIDKNKIDSFLSLIEKKFPGWSGFAHPDFVDAEIDYKHKTIKKAKEDISREQLSQLLKDKNYDEYINRLEKIGRDNNLLWYAVPGQGDIGILYQENLEKASFCEAFFNLLYADESIESRFEKYLNYIKKQKLPNKWTFPTYFLFITYPENEIFVKPETVKWFLDFLDMKDKWSQKPDLTVYTIIKNAALGLKNALAKYEPKDLVDIQSLIWVSYSVSKDQKLLLAHDKKEDFGKTQYWKIAPGEEAWRWKKCREGNYIAIGWNELGDISKMNRSEFDKRRDEKMLEFPHWGKGGANQVWPFVHQIRDGDRIIANQGTKKVLGIGTVVGPYYYAPNEEHAHCLPVDWYDINPKVINEQGWRRTLIKLDREKFDKISNAPEGPKVAEKHIEYSKSHFSKYTFELLSGLHENPTRAFYSSKHEDFKKHLEIPMKQLMQQVADKLPDSITNLMETKKRIFGKILKNDFGKGGAWDYYWGAFYPKGGKRIENPQLSMWINQDRLEYGFFIGEYGNKHRQKFQKYCKDQKEVLETLLKDILEDKDIIYGTRDELSASPQQYSLTETSLKLHDWLEDPNAAGFDVSFILQKNKLLNLSFNSLVTKVTEGFKILFPFVLIATETDPVSSIREYLEITDEDIIELQPIYTLADCSKDTSIDQKELTNWINSIRRKGQAIIYGPPGTGKTFIAEKLAKHIIGGEDGFYDLVQFHPAYSYEDFIQGIRPKAREDGTLDYQMIPGRFLNFCSEAKKRSGTCVLIIDEINRANLARVFGELMYLLEYRNKEIPLAGGEKLSIPDNVRLIGTMNTADRSIALVDHALRRRFAFIPLYPNYTVLKSFHKDKDILTENIITILKELNSEINDKHYHVGITFFLNENLQDHIEDIWKMEIEPYLEEYFFDQPDKVDKYRWEKIQEKLFK